MCCNECSSCLFELLLTLWLKAMLTSLAIFPASSAESKENYFEFSIFMLHKLRRKPIHAITFKFISENYVIRCNHGTMESNLNNNYSFYGSFFRKLYVGPRDECGVLRLLKYDVMSCPCDIYSNFFMSGVGGRIYFIHSVAFLCSYSFRLENHVSGATLEANTNNKCHETHKK